LEVVEGEKPTGNDPADDEDGALDKQAHLGAQRNGREDKRRQWAGAAPAQADEQRRKANHVEDRQQHNRRYAVASRWYFRHPEVDEDGAHWDERKKKAKKHQQDAA
jgi:hypothetical protein